MNENIKRCWEQAELTGQPIDVGNIVVCDVCDGDYTDSEECGGVLFGTYSYCPKCERELMPRICGTSEQANIRGKARPGESFKNFVMRIRDGNNTIQIINGI